MQRGFTKPCLTVLKVDCCSFNLCGGAARIENWYDPNIKSNPPNKTPHTAQIARTREVLYSLDNILLLLMTNNASGT
jgi:hypothetical protein